MKTFKEIFEAKENITVLIFKNVSDREKAVKIINKTSKTPEYSVNDSNPKEIKLYKSDEKKTTEILDVLRKEKISADWVIR